MISTENALATALLTGKLDALPDELTFLLARCGLLHIFTAAGFHLAAAARVADALSWPVRRLLPEGRARLLASALARTALMLWLAGIAGWSAPMARAFCYVTLR